MGGGHHCHPGYRISRRRQRPASVADAKNLRRNHKPAPAPGPPQQGMLLQRHRRYCCFWSARGILAFYWLSLAFADISTLAGLGYTGAFRSAAAGGDAAGAGATTAVTVTAAATTAAASTATAALGKGEHEEAHHQQQGERKEVLLASYLGSDMLGVGRAESRRLSELEEKVAALNSNDGRVDMNAGGDMRMTSSVGSGAIDENEKVVQER